MEEKPRRRQIAVRLNETGLAEVERLAGIETDSNVSLMIRKLLGEALAERQAATPPRDAQS